MFEVWGSHRETFSLQPFTYTVQILAQKKNKQFIFQLDFRFESTFTNESGSVW